MEGNDDVHFVVVNLPPTAFSSRVALLYLQFGPAGCALRAQCCEAMGLSSHCSHAGVCS